MMRGGLSSRSRCSAHSDDAGELGHQPSSTDAGRGGAAGTPIDVDTDVFMHGVRLIGRDRVQYIDDKTFKQLVWYVLSSSDEVKPYLE